MAHSRLNRHTVLVLSALLIAFGGAGVTGFEGELHPRDGLRTAWFAYCIAGMLTGIILCFRSLFRGCHRITSLFACTLGLAFALSLFVPRTRLVERYKWGHGPGYYVLYGWPNPVLYRYLGPWREPQSAVDLAAQADRAPLHMPRGSAGSFLYNGLLVFLAAGLWETVVWLMERLRRFLPSRRS